MSLHVIHRSPGPTEIGQVSRYRRDSWSVILGFCDGFVRDTAIWTPGARGRLVRRLWSWRTHQPNLEMAAAYPECRCFDRPRSAATKGCN